MLHFTTELGGDDVRHRPADGRGRHLRHRPRRGGERRRRRRARRSTASSSSTSPAPRTPASPWPATRSSTAGRWWSPAPSPIRSGRTASPIPTDGDWYLRSQDTAEPVPAGARARPRRSSPGCRSTRPIRGRCSRSTACRRCRSGSATATGPAPAIRRAWRPVAEGDTTLPSGGLVEDRRAWARIEGRRSSLQPDVEFGDDPDYDLDVWKLQVGIDRPVREIDDGVLIAGLTFSYGTVDDRRLLRRRRRQHRHRRLRLRRQPHLAPRRRPLRRRAGAAMWYDSDLSLRRGRRGPRLRQQRLRLRARGRGGQAHPARAGLDGHAAGAARLFLGRLRQLHRSVRRRASAATRARACRSGSACRSTRRAAGAARRRRRAANPLLRHRQPLLRLARRTPRSPSAAPG